MGSEQPYNSLCRFLIGEGCGVDPTSLILHRCSSKSYVWFLHPFESNHCVARFSPLGHCFIIALFYCVLHLLSQLLLSNLPGMLALPNYRCFIVVLHTYENPGNFQRGWGSAQPGTSAP